MTEVAAPQIFLSHSSRDAELVRHVKRALEQARSCQVYLAEDHPQPGEHLPTKLLAAINGSVGFVVLLTAAGAGSLLVHQEIGAAGNAGLPVVAVAPTGIATDSKTLGLLAGQEVIVVDPANPASALLDLQRWFQKLPLGTTASSTVPDTTRQQAEVPPYPPPASHSPSPVGVPSAAEGLVVLALILILAGIALYAMAVSRQT